MSAELLICILTSEPPLDGPLRNVSSLLPSVMRALREPQALPQVGPGVPTIWLCLTKNFRASATS
jgi:hypothetical protein